MKKNSILFFVIVICGSTANAQGVYADKKNAGIEIDSTFTSIKTSENFWALDSNGSPVEDLSIKNSVSVLPDLTEKNVYVACYKCNDDDMVIVSF